MFDIFNRSYMRYELGHTFEFCENISFIIRDVYFMSILDKRKSGYLLYGEGINQLYPFSILTSFLTNILLRLSSKIPLYSKYIKPIVRTELIFGFKSSYAILIHSPTYGE